MPIGRTGSRGKSVAQSSGEQSAHASAGIHVAVDAGTTAVPTGSSDRARIALLKSDINIIQSEIDAYRGDPGGILELQSIIEKHQWTVDPVASSLARDQLNTILLRKINELASVCESKYYGSTIGPVSTLLLPQHSLVSEIAAFFQHRRLAGGAHAQQTTTSSSHQSSAAKPSPSATVSASCPLTAPTARSEGSVEDVRHADKPSEMAAQDPVDDFPTLPRDGKLRNDRAPQRGEFDLLPPAGGGRHTPPSPIEGLSDVDDDEDGVSWGAPQTKPPTSKHRRSVLPATEDSAGTSAAAGKDIVPTPSERHSQADVVTKLTRQLEQAKLQIKFFKSIDKYLLLVQSVGEQVQLLAATPSVESLHTSLQKAVEQFYPQGSPLVASAVNNIIATKQASASPGSPGGKKGAKKDESAATVDPSSISATAALSQLLAGPLDEKKLRVAVAYQNAVIDSLSTNIALQIKEDQDVIHQLKDQVESLQRKLSAQCEINKRERHIAEQYLQRMTNASRLGSPSTFSLTSWIQPATNNGGIPSRPVSRASVADGGGLLGFSRTPSPGLTGQHHMLALPPRPSSTGFAPVDINDHVDAVFGDNAASVAASALPPPRPRGGAKTKPLVATRAEDLDGEKERRYLQVIRTQSDIIKDLSAKYSNKSAASSTTNYAAAAPLNSQQSLNAVGLDS